VKARLEPVVEGVDLSSFPDQDEASASSAIQDEASVRLVQKGQNTLFRMRVALHDDQIIRLIAMLSTC
jgi:hypothetical protein